MGVFLRKQHTNSGNTDIFWLISGTTLVVLSGIERMLTQVLVYRRLSYRDEPTVMVSFISLFLIENDLQLFVEFKESCGKTSIVNILSRKEFYHKPTE
jgi:branched-subunit amino acid ABC-type transport system permease component